MNEIHFLFNDLYKKIPCSDNEIMRDIFYKFSFDIEINIDVINFKYEGKPINENLTLNEFKKNYKTSKKKIIITVRKRPNIKINENIIRLKGVKCLHCGEPCQLRITDRKIYECNRGHHIKNELLELKKRIDKFSQGYKGLSSALKKDKYKKEKINIPETIKKVGYINEEMEKYYNNYINVIKYYETKNYNELKKIDISDDCTIKYINYIMAMSNYSSTDQLLNIINIYNRINSYITIKYEGQVGRVIGIFNINFVKNNKNCVDFILNDKEYKLTKELKLTNPNGFEIKLIGVNNIVDASHMFDKCTAVKSISNIHRWNTSNLKDTKYMFYDCSSLTNLPDISKWDTSNIENMKYMFYNCSSLISMPDISNWNTTNVKYMNNMFGKCTSLKSLPDISKWNTSNVIDMSSIFYNCSSLKYLPDISGWNTSNVTNMESMFDNCSSLLSLPDISKWNTKNVNNMSCMFDDCSSLLLLPDISKWNTEKVDFMYNMFYNCSSLLMLPNISKWKISNVKDISHMFYNCASLSQLPDISKWNTDNVGDMKYLFFGCMSLNVLPNIQKWSSNCKEKNFMYSNCCGLSSIPGISKANKRFPLDLFDNCLNLLFKGKEN